MKKTKNMVKNKKKREKVYQKLTNSDIIRKLNEKKGVI